MNFGLQSLPSGFFQKLQLWFVPIGAGMDWWGPENAIPKGYIAAYGQTVTIGDYPRLAKAWGITTPTFTIPDKRGRMSIGKDDMGGTAANRVTSGGSGIAGNTLYASGGAETVALAAANHASHSHTQRGHAIGSGTAPIRSSADGSAGAEVSTNTATDAQGSGTAHQNMSPGIVCNYIIRAG